MGASLYLDIANLDTVPRTILRNTCPLEILYDLDSSLEGNKTVSPILLSHDSAVAVKNGEETAAGGAPLMTITRESRIVDNEEYYSDVIVCGSANYANGDWLRSKSYANSDIIYNAIRITGRERVLADIEYKVLDKSELVITTADANAWTVVLTEALPVVISVCGAVVYIRRKNL